MGCAASNLARIDVSSSPPQAAPTSLRRKGVQGTVGRAHEWEDLDADVHKPLPSASARARSRLVAKLRGSGTATATGKRKSVNSQATASSFAHSSVDIGSVRQLSPRGTVASSEARSVVSIAAESAACADGGSAHVGHGGVPRTRSRHNIGGSDMLGTRRASSGRMQPGRTSYGSQGVVSNGSFNPPHAAATGSTKLEEVEEMKGGAQASTASLATEDEVVSAAVAGLKATASALSVNTAPHTSSRSRSRFASRGWIDSTLWAVDNESDAPRFSPPRTRGGSFRSSPTSASRAPSFRSVRSSRSGRSGKNYIELQRSPVRLGTKRKLFATTTKSSSGGGAHSPRSSSSKPHSSPSLVSSPRKSKSGLSPLFALLREPLRRLRKGSGSSSSRHGAGKDAATPPSSRKDRSGGRAPYASGSPLAAGDTENDDDVGDTDDVRTVLVVDHCGSPITASPMRTPPNAGGSPLRRAVPVPDLSPGGGNGTMPRTHSAGTHISEATELSYSDCNQTDSRGPSRVTMGSRPSSGSSYLGSSGGDEPYDSFHAMRDNDPELDAVDRAAAADWEHHFPPYKPWNSPSRHNINRPNAHHIDLFPEHLAPHSQFEWFSH